MSAPTGTPRTDTTYLAPAVRLRKLRRGLAAGADPGEDLREVDSDILRVEVTRVHNGASQYSITLNNWFDGLPAGRRDGRAHGGAAGSKGRPAWPRYKYNDFQTLAFGDRIRVDMRYWPEPSERGGGPARPGPSAPSVWTPMVAGPITDMSFAFASQDGARVTISGEDDLSRLKDKPPGRKEFGDLSERRIVERVLAEAGYGLATIAASSLEWPEFATDDAGGIDEAIADEQSYLEFLQKLADRLDFEVFVEFADLDDAAAGVAFHFEPARSGRPRDGVLRDLLVLRRDRHLVEFKPTIKVIDQYSQVVVKGRHRDRDRPERVTQPADPTVVDEELHRDASDPALASGPAIRARYFPGRRNVYVLPNQTNTDADRARQQAIAVLRKKAREFLTIEALTIGLPRLRPGQHVEIRGYRPPFDGIYYVTKTVHTFGADGLRTRLFARRPGMPEPPYNEDATG